MIAAATLSLSHFHERAGFGLDREMAEEKEFETFIRNYQNMVFSVSARIVGNLTDAEDITQEVFIKAYKRFPQLRNSNTIGGWLRTVATNLSINHLTVTEPGGVFFLRNPSRSLLRLNGRTTGKKCWSWPSENFLMLSACPLCYSIF